MKPSCCLVTGASSGIGAALSQVMAGHGHDLVLVARSQQGLEKLGKQLESKYGNRVFPIACDLTMDGAPQALVDRIEKSGLRIGILVNNAGIGDWGLFEQSDWKKQEQMLNLNIVALTHLTRLLLPSMIEGSQGRILNVASTAAFQPGPLMAVYFATKAYVLSFSRALAYELKGKGVTVTCLCPGPTKTGFQQRASIQDIRMEAVMGLSDPYKIADYGYKAMSTGRVLAVPGNLNNALAMAAKFLPYHVTAEFVHLMHA